MIKNMYVEGVQTLNVNFMIIKNNINILENALYFNDNSKILFKGNIDNYAISPRYLVKCGSINGLSILGYSNYSYVTNTWMDCVHATEPGIWKVFKWTDIKI